MSRVLVAGIGNVFFSDDGFGVEMIRRLDPTALPGTVSIADYGIRGVHLAYDLMDGDYDTLILVDAVPLAQNPGTVTVLDATDAATDRTTTVDAHSMSPAVVLQTLHGLGGILDRVLVLGCQPAAIAEGMGLSEPVAAALDHALARLTALIWTESKRQPASRRQTWCPVTAPAPLSSSITSRVSAQRRLP